MVFGSHPSWLYGEVSHKELLAAWHWICPTPLCLCGLFVAAPQDRCLVGVSAPGWWLSCPSLLLVATAPTPSVVALSDRNSRAKPGNPWGAYSLRDICPSGAQETLFPVTALAQLPSGEQVYSGCGALSRQVLPHCWGCCCVPALLPFLMLSWAW